MYNVSTLDIELRKVTQYNLLLIIEVRYNLKWYFRYVRCVQEYYYNIIILNHGISYGFTKGLCALYVLCVYKVPTISIHFFLHADTRQVQR